MDQTQLNEKFIKACDKGDLQQAIQYQKMGAEIYARNDFALICAAANGNLNVVEYLIEYGSNIHARNDYALICAAANGNLNVVIYLVENGADIHTRNNLALHWAAKNRRLHVVEYLVSIIKNETTHKFKKGDIVTIKEFQSKFTYVQTLDDGKHLIKCDECVLMVDECELWTEFKEGDLVWVWESSDQPSRNYRILAEFYKEKTSYYGVKRKLVDGTDTINWYEYCEKYQK